VAPRHERVADAVEDLVQFVHRADLPVLPQVAVAHAQFETIHPFADGNGRTGRALVHSLLRHKGLTTNVTVPVSAGLLADTRSYFAALDAYREGDVEAIVGRVAAAALESLTNGRALVQELRQIRASWQDRLGTRPGSQLWSVAELLLRQPVVTAPLVAEALSVSPTNVYRHLDALGAAGVLRESTDRRRNRVWRSTEVLGALDAFASRVGRRYRETSA
jgi:Fic family protein